MATILCIMKRPRLHCLTKSFETLTSPYSNIILFERTVILDLSNTFLNEKRYKNISISIPVSERTSYDYSVTVRVCPIHILTYYHR